jgi:hypothetical protein
MPTARDMGLLTIYGAFCCDACHEIRRHWHAACQSRTGSSLAVQFTVKLEAAALAHALGIRAWCGPGKIGGEEMTHKDTEKLPTEAHVVCAWPLALIAIGGAIGGGLGGAAYAVNIAIYKSQMPGAAKVVLNLLTGGSAIVLWIVIAGLVHIASS